MLCSSQPGFDKLSPRIVEEKDRFVVTALAG